MKKSEIAWLVVLVVGGIGIVAMAAGVGIRMLGAGPLEGCAPGQDAVLVPVEELGVAIQKIAIEQGLVRPTAPMVPTVLFVMHNGDELEAWIMFPNDDLIVAARLVCWGEFDGGLTPTFEYIRTFELQTSDQQAGGAELRPEDG